MKLLCKLFGHKWHNDCTGVRSPIWGAIVVNYITCRRCGKTEYEYSTKLTLRGESECH